MSQQDTIPSPPSIASLRLASEAERFGHPHAFLSKETTGRVHPEQDDGVRTCFERDGHRILHANPFRRLRNKTQVFFSPENDHITTRLDHSLYVATVSRTICRALGLNDDLAWAISLGHDLGHSPFGHSGERVLQALLQRHAPASDDLYTHEAQSLRVVDLLSSVSGRSHPGLNLTYEVRDGIRCHCGESRESSISPRSRSDRLDPSTFQGRNTLPATMEGCVVRMADRIAYLGRDYEDATTALGSLLPHLPEEVARTLGSDNRGIINTLVLDLIAWNQRHPEEIGFSARVYDGAMALRDFNYEHIYGHPRLEEYRFKIDAILERLFAVHLATLEETPPERWSEAVEGAPLHLAYLARFVDGAAYPEPQPPARVVVDWLSLMTDGFAFKMFESVVLPSPLV